MEALPEAWLDLLQAGCVLLVALVAGTLAHESTHVAVLEAFSIPYEVDFRPEGSPGALGALVRPLATVTPRPVPASASPVGIRLAAIAPLLMVGPPLLVMTGTVTVPPSAGDPLLAAAIVGWAGCAIPSPQDFSTFWRGGRAVTDADAPGGSTATDPATRVSQDFDGPF